ncbi:MAG: SWIM zinc finger family protein, partial [Ilumatobacteraceae bacterium]
AGLVGASPGWHADVLAELGVLHLLSQSGRRIMELPGPLADEVATAVGWQVRKADVLAGVPDTDRWVVAGRSDTREDRIEVRRHWLRGTESGRWAMVLSFAAFRQSLDTSLEVGSALSADLQRYPGTGLRALVGLRHGEPESPAAPPATTIAGACDEVGGALAVVPWLDRLAATVHAGITGGGGDWSLTDDTGSLPLRPGADPDGIAALLAVSEGRSVDVTIEWTPHGVVPLAVHLPDRTVDIGPRADESFVSAA